MISEEEIAQWLTEDGLLTEEEVIQLVEWQKSRRGGGGKRSLIRMALEKGRMTRSQARRFIGAHEIKMKCYADIDMGEADPDEQFEDQGNKTPLKPAKEEITAKPVLNFIAYVLTTAINTRASDIHIERWESGPVIRLRTDGHLIIMEMAKRESSFFADHVISIVSSIKVRAGMDVAEKRIPQDGKFTETQASRRVDFRVAVSNTIRGEEMVIRVLNPQDYNRPLGELNYPERILTDLREKILDSSDSGGLFLVTGPTGSGKTTALYSILNLLKSEEVKIITIEDPVEIGLDGITQYQVAPGAGLTFAKLLRSVLRQDPNVILVGEIRDPETAETALSAAQTGHLVLSTLHSNDAIGTVLRLVSLHGSRNQIADTLRGAMAQVLVRTLCENCKQECDPPDREWRLFYSARPDFPFYKDHGCGECNDRGYLGRIVVPELFVLDPEIRRVLIETQEEGPLRKSVLDSGFVPMLTTGLSRVEKGLTTLEELLKVFPLEMIDEHKKRTRG